MNLSNAKLHEGKHVPYSNMALVGIREMVADIVRDLMKNSELMNKKLSPEACLILSDAIAMGSLLEQNAEKLDEKSFKRSASRFKNVVTALFEEQYDFLDLRQQIKQSQQDLVKQINPRSLDPKILLVDGWPEGTADATTEKKTCSPIMPERIAEKILRDLNESYYYCAQEAYDGYCQPHGIWQYASARQKCALAGLLRVFGFIIKNDADEKEAEADLTAWKKKHADLGKGERGPEKIPGIEPNKIEEDFSDSVQELTPDLTKKAGVSIEYCSNCGKSQRGTQDDKGNFICGVCGTKKENHKLSMIAMIRKEQMDQARPNILENVKQQLVNTWNQFQKPISSYDVIKEITNQIDSNYTDPTENQEEKQYLLANPAISDEVMRFLQENNIPMSTKIDAELSKRASEVQDWISGKIKYLVDKEGLTQEQAVGKAEGMADEKFPGRKKKAQMGSPADQQSIATNPQDNSSQTEMTKMSNMMRCSNKTCGFILKSAMKLTSKIAQMSPDGGDQGGNPMPPAGGDANPGMNVQGQKCPKCGSMMEKYAEEGSGKFPFVDKTLNTTQEFASPDAQPNKKYMSDGSQYMANKKPVLAFSSATESPYNK